MAQSGGRYAGEEVDCGHGSVECIVGAQFFAAVLAVECVGVEVYAQAYFGQRGVVAALEGVEVVGAALGGAVATPQEVLEQNGYLAYHRQAEAVGGGCYLQGGDEILLTVGADFAYWQLRAGDNHRLAQVFEHERQSRSRVGHGVGAMQNHETVVTVIILDYASGNILPVGGMHVAGIERRLELNVVDVVVEHLYLGHVVH